MIRSYKGITPTIPASCYVDDSAQIIGDVVLGEHASIWMNAVLRGDVHSIRIEVAGHQNMDQVGGGLAWAVSISQKLPTDTSGP